MPWISYSDAVKILQGIPQGPETINYGEHPVEEADCPPKCAGMPVS